MSDNLDLSSFDDAIKNHPSSVSGVSLPETQDPGTIHDLLLGGAQGATLGFGDELLAALETAGQTVSGKSKLEDLYNTYRKLQQENEASVAQAHERSPWATGIGELAGGLILPGGAMIGAGKEAALGARMLAGAKAGIPIGALAGAGYSQANIENIPQLAQDTAVGAGLGAAGGAAAEGIIGGLGKAGEAVKKQLQKTNVGENIVQAMDTGLEGGGYISKESEKRIAALGKEAKETGLNALYGEEGPLKQTSKKLGNYLVGASEKGAIADADENLTAKLAQTFQDLEDNNLLRPTKKLEDIDDPILGSIYKAFNRKSDTNHAMSSTEIKTFSDNVNKLLSNQMAPDEAYNFARWLQGDKIEGMASLKGSKFKELIGDDLIYSIKQSAKDAADKVMGEGEGAKLTKEFGDVRAGTVDTFLNKGAPEKLAATWGSDMSKTQAQAKIYKELDNVIKTIGDPTAKGDDAREMMQTFAERVASLKKNYPDLNLDTDAMLEQIKKAGRERAIRNKLVAEGGHDASTGGIISRAIDYTGYGGANLTGQVIGSTRNFLKGGDSTLLAGAKALQSSPSTARLGQALESAVNNKSRAAINASTFSIMQNPDARKALGLSVKDQGKED